jgi:acetyl esterase/lipase
MFPPPPPPHRLTLNFPGGGFIAMGPEFHTDYLTAIALRTRIPVLTVDYRKALEFPFPAQLLDCFDVYKAVVDSAGTVAGLNTALPAAVAAASPASNSPASTAAANALAAAAADAATSTAAGAADAESAPRPLKLVLFGDSAGGNLATAVVLRAIVLGMPLPCGLHLIYPILEMTSRFWKAQTHVKIEPAATTTPADAAAAAAAGAVPIPAPPQITAVQPRSGAGSPETAANGSSPDPIATLRAPEMTSRAKFSGDAVLPFRYLLVIGQTLFRGGGDPASDMYCSPLLAPDALFAQFPPTSVHVGSVDPLCDDSVGLCERIRRANPAIPVKLDVIPGVSHAYMNVTALLPEGQRALDRTIGWIFEFHALARDKQGILPSYALKQHQQQQQQQQRHQQQLHQQQLLQQQGGAATVALASAPLLQTAQQAGEHARAAAAAAANAAAQAAAMGALTLKNGQALSMWPTLAPLLPQGQQQQPVDSSSVDATLANTVAAVAAETAAGTEATEATEDPAPAAAADSAVGAAPAPVAAKAPAVEDRSPAML